MHARWHILVTLPLVLAGLLTLPLRDEPHQALRLPSAYASLGLDPAHGAYQGDNDDEDNDDGDNDDGDEDDNGNDNDGDGDEDDFALCSIYEELGMAPPPSLGCSPSVAAPARPPEPTCTTPGRDAVFTSHDGKVALRVFSSSPLPVRVVIYQVINAEAAPAPPGTYVRPLVYEVAAGYCGDATRLPEFPAEVNLGIRYSDLEAAGLDEGRFVIGRLDLGTATWVPVEKQANDPPANYVSATITRTGYYMVWESR